MGTETRSAAAARDPMIGRTVSHYQIIDRLGEGGMGVVYWASDLTLKRTVALKFLRKQEFSPDETARFVSEAQVAAVLDHPNICTVFEIGEDAGRMFIAMAYVGGQSLARKIAERALPPLEAVDIAMQIAQGLEEAHRHGIVHRDVKSANVIITPAGLPKIVDFGLAHFPGRKRITGEGHAAGTPAYMSPEQARGDPLDCRTDLWSLGVVLYEMLTGRLPFRGESPLALVHSITSRAFEPAHGLPQELSKVIEKALAKHRSERYASASELIADLQDVRKRLAAAPKSDPAARAVPSIAVLPFANLSRDDADAYFSDGLTDELIHMLSQIGGLHVVSRTSAFEFKNKPQDIRLIGQRLNVSSVLEGAVRRAGERVRVTAQLTGAADGYQLWSERYDREVKDIFGIQDEIAQTIVSTLKVKLASDANPIAHSETQNLEAYHLYLKGRYYLNKQTPEGLEKAIEHFERALAAAPDHAPSWCGLADCYSYLGFWSALPAGQAWPKAREAALKAVSLRDSLSDGHTSLGYVLLFYDWDRQQAEREFRTAIDLSPASAHAHYAYSVYLTQTGRFDAALREVKRAQTLDPLNLIINTGVGFVHYYARQYEKAIEELRNTLELDPNYFEAQAAMGLAYQQMRAYDRAILCFETARRFAGDIPLVAASLAAVYAEAGQTAQARELLPALESNGAPMMLALVHIGLGDHERALELMDQAADARDAYLCYLKVAPSYDCLRSHHRYAALLRKLRLDND